MGRAQILPRPHPAGPIRTTGEHPRRKHTAAHVRLVGMTWTRDSHYPEYEVEVKVHSRPLGCPVTHLALHELSQRGHRTMAYVQSEAPAAVEAEVERSFPGGEMMSEVVGSVYAVAVSYSWSLSQ